MTSRPNAAESVTSAPHPTADPLTLCNACDATPPTRTILRAIATTAAPQAPRPCHG